MKNSYILIVIFLLLASAGTYFSYMKYFLPIQNEYATNKKTAEDYLKKIKKLEKTFGKREPERVIEQLNEAKQPWLEASRKHVSYFYTEAVEKAEMPEDVIPSFWYKEKYPKIQAELNEYAREKGVFVQALNFNILPPSHFEGKSPTRREVLDEVDKFNYGIAMTKFILTAKPKVLQQVVIWPVRTVRESRSGEVKMHTTGYRMQIMNEDLIRFLESLNQWDTYMNVNGIKITKKPLPDPRAPLDVELLITTANVIDSNKATE